LFEFAKPPGSSKIETAWKDLTALTLKLSRAKALSLNIIIMAIYEFNKPPNKMCKLNSNCNHRYPLCGQIEMQSPGSYKHVKRGDHSV